MTAFMKYFHGLHYLRAVAALLRGQSIIVRFSQLLKILFKNNRVKTNFGEGCASNQFFQFFKLPIYQLELFWQLNNNSYFVNFFPWLGVPEFLHGSTQFTNIILLFSLGNTCFEFLKFAA